ncbi:unnamed protein product, partial [Leptidea sinapis]
MNVIRSPGGTNSQSQPDLSRIDDNTNESPPSPASSITFRKRKFAYIDQNNSCICKKEIQTQNNIKTKVQELENKLDLNDHKYHAIEHQLNTLKNSASISQCTNDMQSTEHYLRELQDRSKRANNIIMAGIIESKNTDSKARLSDDESRLRNILSRVIKDCPNPIKISRLGKYASNKTRKFNKYFSTIGTILANQIPSHSHYTQKNTTSCSSADTTKPSLFSLEPCSVDEVNQIIDQLHPNCSTVYIVPKGNDCDLDSRLNPTSQTDPERLKRCLNSVKMSSEVSDT